MGWMSDRYVDVESAGMKMNHGLDGMDKDGYYVALVDAP